MESSDTLLGEGEGSYISAKTEYETDLKTRPTGEMRLPLILVLFLGASVSQALQDPIQVDILPGEAFRIDNIECNQTLVEDWDFRVFIRNTPGVRVVDIYTVPQEKCYEKFEDEHPPSSYPNKLYHSSWFNGKIQNEVKGNKQCIIVINPKYNDKWIVTFSYRANFTCIPTPKHVGTDWVLFVASLLMIVIPGFFICWGTFALLRCLGRKYCPRYLSYCENFTNWLCWCRRPTRSANAEVFSSQTATEFRILPGDETQAEESEIANAERSSEVQTV